MPKYTTQEIKPKCRAECILFEKCSAPLCPVDNESHPIWFSDEDICTNELFQDTKMIINQRKLRKFKTKGYFTADSLKELSRIGKKTKGKRIS